jgi:hypothetical protein
MVLSLQSPFAAHPGMLPEADSAKWEAWDTPAFTLDMDDMLRTSVRQKNFDFEAAARQIQTYVVRVRACGGILPDEVVEVLYTADVCRRRWAHLDFLACQAYQALAAPAAAAAPPAAAPQHASRGAAGASTSPLARPAPAATAKPSGGGDGTSDDDDDDDGASEDEPSDDYGVVDLDALRAQRLGGLFGAAPKPAANPRGVRGTSRSDRRSQSATTSAAATSRSAAPPLVGPMMGAPAATPPDLSVFSGRSKQLAELEQLAAELSSASPARPPQTGASDPPTGTCTPGTTTTGAAAEQHKQAAATLLEPLGELKRRMEGLEALLADEEMDMAAKLGEVAQVHREMAELQSLAQKCHAQPQPPPPPPSAAVVVGGGVGGGTGAAVAAHVAAESRSEPLSIAPATGQVSLEAALDGLDIDGLLERLEAEQEAER